MRANRGYLIFMSIIIALLLITLFAVIIDRNSDQKRREKERAEAELRDAERKATIAALFENSGSVDDTEEEAEEEAAEEKEKREIEYKGKRLIGSDPDMEGEILKPQNPPENILFVGDSRTVGMKWAVGRNKYKWVAESGMGYGWLAGTAGPMLSVSANAGVKMVFNLGVNDPGNGKKYAEYLNKRIDKWDKAGVKVYYVSVNPVIDGYSNATNEKVNACNEVLKDQLDERIGWIDTNSYLFERGFNTKDGLHYDEDTYRAIYGYILKTIEEDESDDTQTE